MAAYATFTLKAGAWFRGGRLPIVAAVQQHACTL